MNSHWIAVLFSMSIIVIQSGCDDSGGPESTGTEATDGEGTGGATESATDAESTDGGDTGEATSSGTTGAPPPWTPGPDCPQVPYYTCSEPPNPQWNLFDEQGCLPKPCSPGAEKTGCADGEECVMHDECMTLIAGCFEENGTCTCETDPTCIDFGCRVLP